MINEARFMTLMAVSNGLKHSSRRVSDSGIDEALRPVKLHSIVGLNPETVKLNSCDIHMVHEHSLC